MPNKKGWYTIDEVKQTGLPYYITTSKRWTKEPFFAVLLSKTRCKEFGVPILPNGHEKPSAFRYCGLCGMGTDDQKHRFIPLYDRTSLFLSGELDLKRLFDHEIMGRRFLDGMDRVSSGACQAPQDA